MVHDAQVLILKSVQI